MPEVRDKGPMGVLRPGWTAELGDYAIAGDWARGGKMFVAADSAGGVFAFDSKSGENRWSQGQTHEGGTLCLAVHPRGALVATGGQDGRVLIWSAVSGELRQTLELGRGWVENLAWSPDGQWLATSVSRRVHIYSAKGDEVFRSADYPSTVSALAWAGPRELASACYGKVAFINVPSGDVRQTLEWKGSLVSMVLSPDGDIVACGSQDNTVHFWRRSTGHDSMMSGYPTKPAALAFDRTGSFLATSGGIAVTVWCFQGNGPEGTRPGVLSIHTAPITSLTFARRGRRLASGGRDGGIVVWGLADDGNGDPLGAVLVDDVVSDLSWRPDGKALAALDGRGGVHVWRVKS